MKKFFTACALASLYLCAPAQLLTVTVDGNPVANGDIVESSTTEIMEDGGMIFNWELKPHTVIKASEDVDISVYVTNPEGKSVVKYVGKREEKDVKINFCGVNAVGGVPSQCVMVNPGKTSNAMQSLDAGVEGELQCYFMSSDFVNPAPEKLDAYAQVKIEAKGEKSEETMEFVLHMIYPEKPSSPAHLLTVTVDGKPVANGEIVESSTTEIMEDGGMIFSWELKPHTVIKASEDVDISVFVTNPEGMSSVKYVDKEEEKDPKICFCGVKTVGGVPGQCIMVNPGKTSNSMQLLEAGVEGELQCYFMSSDFTNPVPEKLDAYAQVKLIAKGENSEESLEFVLHMVYLNKPCVSELPFTVTVDGKPVSNGDVIESSTTEIVEASDIIFQWALKPFTVIKASKDVDINVIVTNPEEVSYVKYVGQDAQNNVKINFYGVDAIGGMSGQHVLLDSGQTSESVQRLTDNKDGVLQCYFMSTDSVNPVPEKLDTYVIVKLMSNGTKSEEIFEFTLHMIYSSKDSDNTVCITEEIAGFATTVNNVVKGKPVRVTFAPADGWKVGCVKFNDENVTESVSNNVFITPALEEDARIVASYEYDGNLFDASLDSDFVTDFNLVINSENGELFVKNLTSGMILNIYTIDGAYIGQYTVNDKDVLSIKVPAGVFVITITLEGKTQAVKVINL